MALRKIRLFGDPVLEKTAKPIRTVSPRMRILAADMLETMYKENGVGLAAPQVGILRRMFVVDVDRENSYVFINPEILETSGSQTGEEGCLSLPGKCGKVTRPNYVKVRATDIRGKQFEMEAEGLLARAILHENDHLNGVLYTSHVEGPVLNVEDFVDDEPEESAGEDTSAGGKKPDGAGAEAKPENVSGAEAKQ
ncbi:MAG: peptide deformylase [Bilifractor sp.]|jgi:peptide deformylase